MNTIRILPETLASQIAAGEVVDRPASIVRELIDNSIDAGADRITVRIENGGKRRIQVSDNGAGMSRDDLLLCVERHATSKIRTASDLLNVRSLGFRGEALPSIAAVSRVQITSLPKDQLTGHKLRISGGKLLDIEETGAPVGTTVDVKDLFFNIPARRKFLRAERTETDHVVDALSRIAMPFSQIVFRLDDGPRNILHLPASEDNRDRIAGLMGRRTAEAMLIGEENGADLSVKAYVAPSDFSRNRGDRVYLYVNKRNIRDRLATKAIMEGYGQRLMKGQYPQAVVFIDIDPMDIDVNVHPTKQEIRFRNASRVFQAIVSAVERGLERSPHPRAREASVERVFAPQHRASTAVSEPLWEYLPRPVSSETAEIPLAPVRPSPGPGAAVHQGPRIIGQLGDTYILCQTSEGLMIVDQHAAHERIVYEHLKKSFAAERIETQTLLIPQELELSNQETRVMLEKGEGLRRFGIELSHFGGNTFLLTAVPALLKRVDWPSFVSELIPQLAEGPPDPGAPFDGCLMLMACHGAIRAGQGLSQEEMAHLLRELEGMDLPTHCPHGRPIRREVTYDELEKMFKRVV